MVNYRMVEYRNYRIRRETVSGKSSYNVERKILGFLWVEMFPDFLFGSIRFNSYNDAVDSLLEKIKKSEKVKKVKIEYLPVNLGSEAMWRS